MDIQDTSIPVLPAQDRQDMIRPSPELGTPSLSLLQVSRSPSLPAGSLFWDQMDQMSLPSSPSPIKAADSTMDLDRYMQRGFSEDLALPPRQIEKPFRFLDLPAELRNMIYDLVFCYDRCDLPPSTYYDSSPASHPSWSSADWHDPRFISSMKQQWHPPRLSLVSKQLRLETLFMFYSADNFEWYWDPAHVGCERFEEAALMDSLNFLQKAMAFLGNHNLWMKGINVCTPGPYRYSVWRLEPLVESIRLLAPLSRSSKQTGKAHQVLGKVHFGYNNSFSHRIFDFAGTLESKTLGNKRWLDEDIRTFLRGDRTGRGILRNIENLEAMDRYDEYRAREARKKERRDDNFVKGERRWRGVLRSRVTKGDK